jgi:hypothetical protein
MAIKEHLTYDVSKDCVQGVEDLGFMGKTQNIANHASVFMVRGLVDKWKQPVGSFLTSGTMSSIVLKSMLLTCIDKVQETGLIVKAVICDQGSNNRSMISKLGVSVKQPNFLHNGRIIHVFYDPPHLLKNIRNNLKKSGFTVEDNNITWKYVEQFYAIDSSLPIRMAPRLSYKHVSLPPFTAMKVSLAAQVLSHSVAAGITTLCMTGDKLDDDAIYTANFCEKFDCLFNCFNSSNLQDAHRLRCAITGTSSHMAFLSDCLKWLCSVKTIGKKSDLPCLAGWKIAVQSLMNLWDNVQKNFNIQFLLTRRLNQDCLELFFRYPWTRRTQGQSKCNAVHG